jgi:methionyl-tRNA formyltransferase
MQTLQGLLENTLHPRVQDHAAATYTKYIEKSDGDIQPSWTIDETYHRWQAYTPWPGLYTSFGETKVHLLGISRHPFTPSETSSISHESSSLLWSIRDGLPAITLLDGYLSIHQIHPAGKKPMSGEDFVRGYMGKL